jgi:glycosyltransferase involved in cell wall biosynthesis
MNNPLVSVFIPVFNRELYVKKAIDSVLNQSYKNIEIIVLDDCSTDKSYLIVSNFMQLDVRIKLFKNPQNFGISKTRNIGLRYCSGKYIALLDSDDFYEIDKIEKQVNFLESNLDYAAVSSWMQLFDDKCRLEIVKYRTDIEEIKAIIPFYSPVSHPASMFRSEVLKQLGYRENFIVAEDYDLWFRILQNYSIGVIPLVLYQYRIHEKQSTHPDNFEIECLSNKLIASNILEFFAIPNSSQVVDFHVRYCMHSNNIETKEVFIKWDMHLRMFLNKNKHFFKDEVFKDFVFKNYWQTYYSECVNELTLIEIIKILASPFCLFYFTIKMKILIKKLLF